ncbi:hypothetical protein [Streptomyces sp. NRRL B-24484]|uniref:hypothetical protein n=1 Tax=Streptomyces sp. NRRL B-24484 TaxID=1463833 RepID=UPI000693DC35|nr:hypothetical protein [Streptomyces sp. NRRL B-24484]
MTESGHGIGSRTPTAAERPATVGDTRRPAVPDAWARPGTEPPTDPPTDPGQAGTALRTDPGPHHGPDAPHHSPEDPHGTAEDVPRPAAGLTLQGEYRDSGFTAPRYLVRRADGQMVQLSRLLYLVAEAMDGTRTRREIAHLVAARSGLELGPEHITHLLDHKLRPLGLLAPPDGTEADAPVPVTDLLLALRAHRVLLRPPSVNTVAAALSWLHRPAAVAVVLLFTAAADVWLFAVHGAMTPVLHTVQEPALLLAVLALTVLSTVFHEFGHASGCRYGGGRPGCIGCGIYLVWPAMYTDVTDVYRLRRPDRLRTDLGGVYFNAVFVAVLFAAYFATGRDFLLAAVYVAHFEIVEQLLPVLRLDGYYILADLAGVPDLFGKVRPILRSMLPWRPVPPEVAGLKRSSRAIVTAWVLAMVPLLVAEVVYVLWNAPRLLRTAVDSFTGRLADTADAFAAGAPAAAALGVIGLVMLLLPTAGLVYLVVRLARRAGRALTRAHRTPRGRAALLLTAAACTGAALALAWGHRAAPVPLAPRPPPARAPAPADRTELSVTPSAALARPPSAAAAPSPTDGTTAAAPQRGRPSPAPARTRAGRTTSAATAPAPAPGSPAAAATAAPSPTSTVPAGGGTATAPSGTPTGTPTGGQASGEAPVTAAPPTSAPTTQATS